MASEGAKGVTGGPRDGADGRGFCFTERFGPLFAALGSQPVGGAAFPSFAECETLDALPVGLGAPGSPSGRYRLFLVGLFFRFRG